MVDRVRAAQTTPSKPRTSGASARLRPERGVSQRAAAERPQGRAVRTKEQVSGRGAADEDLFAAWNRLAHYSIGRFTAGVSPAALMLAYGDWWSHLMISPGKQAQLVYKAWRKTNRFAAYLPRAVQSGRCPPCVEPLAHDKRFRDGPWQEWPFNVIQQSFLLTQQWWHNATTGIEGVSKHHENVVNFTIRQIQDMFSPANFLATNPKVLRRTLERGGQNLVDGACNFWADIARLASDQPPQPVEQFAPGQAVAITPGKVVFRNRLIELIQYSPATAKVQAEPVLIVPAWIMKYYILDLSPHNSLVRWLVEQGYSVFMVSWKNPSREDRDLTLEDYRRLGVLEALTAVNAIVPERKVHAVGYCLGGTLLSIAAAAMARTGDDRLVSVTLFAALTDFEEAGELELFIDDSQVHFLEDLMWQQGYLEARQMKSVFQLLQSNDLIWSRVVQEYLMGERAPAFDLMAWSTDGTRMPFRMHSEYLRHLYLANQLAEAQYRVDGYPVALSDIELPLFVVGTRKDHIAPWRSVYKVHLLAGGEVTFVLTSGGHNAGVVSEPGHSRRVYQIAAKQADAAYVDPNTWFAEVPERAGSWWPEWCAWLAERSSGKVRPPVLGAPERGYPPLEDAPGQYVLQR
ncbi:MAG: alpha/beta fold hydrolase [Nitrococcus mobilis]|nr:alpha/beta fold hydrolase [Nitrococcus mobilis]